MLNLPSPTWSWTRGSSYPTASSGKNFLLTYNTKKTLRIWSHGKKRSGYNHLDIPLTSITMLSISHISIRSTELWRQISLRTPPSPPPTTRTCIKNITNKQQGQGRRPDQSIFFQTRTQRQREKIVYTNSTIFQYSTVWLKITISNIILENTVEAVLYGIGKQGNELRE